MSNLSSTSSELKTQTQSTLARNLALARSASNMTQDDLADKARLSRATIAQIEGGDGDPKLTTIIEIAIALGVSPVLLLLDEEDLKSLAAVSHNMPRSKLSEADIQNMRRLIQSGISKKIAEAVNIGASAARSMGLTTTGAVIGAAIGGVLLPGVTSIVFAACLGTALSRKWISSDSEKERQSNADNRIEEKTS